MDREQVYKLIDGERDYQDSKWNPSTTATGGNHATPEEWIVYMKDYLDEATHLLTREPSQISYPLAMATIRKVAALAVASMEQIETPERKM